MQVAKFKLPDGPVRIGVIEGQNATPLHWSDTIRSLSDLLDADDPRSAVEELLEPRVTPFTLSEIELLPPIDRQEVWAAGVTYRRSRTARMEESQGAARFYDLVYEAPRPELFFKSTPHRVVGPKAAVRIRRDATWNVPEPELTVVLNRRSKIVGFTIGNDMSSRDIEGENPLYLPQAKCYDGCCALGPWITLADAMPTRESIRIDLLVRRVGGTAFEGHTTVGHMARTLEDLVDWLTRECSFPDGAFLLTGTGIVPTEEFTLQAGDVVEISIDGIGTLINSVEQRT